MPDLPGTEPDNEPDNEPGNESARPVLEKRATARTRLTHDFLHPSRRQLVVAVLLALVGFAAIVQIRTTGNDSTYAGYREQDLIDVLNGLSGTTQRTQAEIDRLTAARADLQTESSRRKAALEQAQKEVDSLDVLSGLVPVTGPGVRVTITEESGTVDVSSMLDLIQELRATSAEAIQINGTVRVVAQTSFESGVGGLVVDGQLVESPYVVDAIGLSSTLRGAVEFPLGPRRELEKDGATVDVVELTSLDIDAVRKAESPEFAQPEP